jgi:hypothetical protein
VEYARRQRPDIHIIARAGDRRHVYALHSSGADEIVRETFDASVRVGKRALVALGVHPFRAERAARVFVDFDQESVRRLAEVYDPAISVFENPEYVAVAKERTALMEAAMRGVRTVLHDRTERGWTPPPKPETGEQGEVPQQVPAETRSEPGG